MKYLYISTLGFTLIIAIILYFNHSLISVVVTSAVSIYFYSGVIKNIVARLGKVLYKSENINSRAINVKIELQSFTKVLNVAYEILQGGTNGENVNATVSLRNQSGYSQKYSTVISGKVRPGVPYMYTAVGLESGFKSFKDLQSGTYELSVDTGHDNVILKSILVVKK